MVGPQDTYEAGPNGNEVLRPNPGTNILTTNHICRYSLGKFHVHLCLTVKAIQCYIANDIQQKNAHIVTEPSTHHHLSIYGKVWFS